MYNNKIEFKTIGIIFCPHKEISKTPVQSVYCNNIEILDDTLIIYIKPYIKDLI